MGKFSNISFLRVGRYGTNILYDKPSFNLHNEWQYVIMLLVVIFEKFFLLFFL